MGAVQKRTGSGGGGNTNVKGGRIWHRPFPACTRSHASRVKRRLLPEPKRLGCLNAPFSGLTFGEGPAEATADSAGKGRELKVRLFSNCGRGPT